MASVSLNSSHNSKTLPYTYLGFTPADERAKKKKREEKNADLRYNKKAGKSDPVTPKCKMVEILHRNDRHRPNIGLNPKFLGYSNSP